MYSISSLSKHILHFSVCLCGFIILNSVLIKNLKFDKIRKLKKIIILIASVALFYSCDKAKTSETVSEARKSDSAIVGNDLATSVSASENAVTPAPVNASPVASTSGKPALNPAHGEPYHRCEIAVGAPIDSAPAQQNAPQTKTPSILRPTVAPAPQAQSFGPKPAMNPAHGEPHHRCDLAVGAPLT